MSNRKLLFIFHVILGFSIVFYTFYRRVIFIRLPKDLYFWQDDQFNYNLLLFALIGFSLCTYIFYKSIKLFFDKGSSTTWINRILYKINLTIENALFEVYTVIGNRMFFNPYTHVSFLAQKFYKYFHKKPETFFLFILYFIRLIILCSFLIDIFIFFKLNYFYKASYLLCISLLVKILFYILKDFSNNLEETASFLDITSLSINTETNLPRTSYHLKEKYKHLDLHYHVGQFILCSKISGYLHVYERYSDFFTPRFNILLYFLYTIGWSFILIKNIFLV